jgi:hypothetical protein
MFKREESAVSLFRGLLGPSQREVWERLSQAIDAEYDPGGLFKRPRVLKRVSNWTITLTASKSPGPSQATKITTTRLRAPFVCRDGFRFTIERKSRLGKSGKPIGRHYVASGHPEFDAEFWVNTRDQAKVHALLDDEGFRRSLRAQSSLWLKVKDDAGWFGPKFPENVDLLMFEEIDVKPMTDVSRLGSLFALVEATLERLCRIGSATEDDPGLVV